MGRHSTASTTTEVNKPDFSSRKRKRDPNLTAEIAVDVSAPEPPSKKAQRKAKKAKPKLGTTVSKLGAGDPQASSEITIGDYPKTHNAVPKRSGYGIWIGNLPWTATKTDLRTFFTRDTAMTEDMIIRLHMPSPSSSTAAASRQKIKPQNQGYAYVDFSSQDALAEALGLSERLFTGRRVLIKDAKSFEGRPKISREDNRPQGDPTKPLSRRVFVGNLGFDTTNEILQNHFAVCGDVADVHVATFEDSGKCKGYAWVDFVELQASEAAVRGWVNIQQSDNIENEDEEIAEALAEQAKLKKNSRSRKWWVNRLGGDSLRIEFAEGKDIRYRKRYGKGAPSKEDEGTGVESMSQTIVEPVDEAKVSAKKVDWKTRHKTPIKKVDARSIKPGAALAAAPRLSGSIIESQGKKTTFT